MSRLVRDVMTDAPVVSPDTSGEFVYDLFSDDKDLLVVAVVQDGQPVGMVSRDRFFVKMADRHGRALFSKRPVTFLMNKDPLLVEASTPMPLLELSALLPVLASNATRSGIAPAAAMATMLSTFAAKNHKTLAEFA